MRISGSAGSTPVASIALEGSSSQLAASAETQTGDSVTFSSLAREREAAAAHPRFGGLSVAAHQDPKLAKQLAYDTAHALQEPLYDLRGLQDGSGPLRYSYTGEVVTPESEAHYHQLGKDLQAASIALYDEEKAKGTDPADIFDKLIALGDKQPEEFRTIINWDGDAG